MFASDDGKAHTSGSAATSPGQAGSASHRNPLLATQRLEGLGWLAATLAHDLNNLLGTVLGNAMLAQEDLAEDHPAAARIGMILRAARGGRALTRMVLECAREPRTEPRALDLNAEVRRLAPLLEMVVERGPQLRLRLAPGLPPARADTSGLQQILLNLVTNAAQAMEDRRGTVVVSTGATSGGGKGRDAARVWLRVEDTGAGMDAATRERVFEPFFTTRKDGTGLGLAAVRALVCAYAGAVTVESRPGEGTVVTVLLESAPSA